MPENKNNNGFNIYEVMPGSKIVTYDKYQILIGSPLEVVKIIIGKKLPIPTHLIFPDTMYVGSIPQNSTEFLIYYFLFAYQGLAKGLQFTLIGAEQQIETGLELIRIALLGLSEEELIKTGCDTEIAHMLANESEFYRLKAKDGRSLTLEELVQYRVFDKNNIVKTDTLKIKKKNKNVFEFTNEKNEKIEVDVNFNTEQLPPYFVPKNKTPYDFLKFGVHIIGSSSGFSPINPCSGMVLSYNGSYILIDPIPYVDYLLKARGISKNQIDACLITHIHDDHCVLLPFLFYSKRMKILTTPEIFYMSMYKLSLTLNSTDYKEMEKYFEFIPITPGEEQDYYGMKILPHYTLHPIPTIGAKFSIKHKDKSHTFTYVGDNQSLSIVDGMYDKGIINSERKKVMKELYTEEVDLFIADGGHGMIHGDPADGKESKAKKIAFIHLDDLPEEYKTMFNLASVGKTFEIIKETGFERMSKTLEYLKNIFKEDIDSEWIPHLMNYNEVVKYNSGDIIIRQGYEEDARAFIILSGYCKVYKRTLKKTEYLTTLEAGDIVGEIALIMDNEQRTATVIADTPVTLCEFNREAFKSFAVEKELLFKLSTVWTTRERFTKIEPFNRFPSRALTELAMISKEIIFGMEHQINVNEKCKNFYVIVEGNAIMKKGSKEVTLNAGDLFGDFSFLLERVINYEVYVPSYLHCMVISKKDIENYTKSTPIMNYHLNTVTMKFIKSFI